MSAATKMMGSGAQKMSQCKSSMANPPKTGPTATARKCPSSRSPLRNHGSRQGTREGHDHHQRLNNTGRHSLQDAPNDDRVEGLAQAADDAPSVRLPAISGITLPECATSQALKSWLVTIAILKPVVISCA